MTIPKYTFEVTYNTDGAVTYKTGFDGDIHCPSTYFDFVETSLSLLCDDDDDERSGLYDEEHDELFDKIYEDICEDDHQRFYNIHKKLFGNMPFSDHEGDDKASTNAYHAVLQEIEELQQYCKDRPTPYVFEPAPYVFDPEVDDMVDKLFSEGSVGNDGKWRSFNDF